MNGQSTAGSRVYAVDGVSSTGTAAIRRHVGSLVKDYFVVQHVTYYA